MMLGVYRVLGTREYRGHAPGEVFEARLDRGAERRAIVRGSIELIEKIHPDLRPGSWKLPDGWRGA